jgi:CDP-diacylglycerol--glycerol-3-phosphate 3-phosphatidyltransferase
MRSDATPLLNVPNVLSAFRLAGSVVLFGLALAKIPDAFGWLLAALLVSDWIDGKLAIAWRQQTTFGARLDSVADASMYSALLFGLIWLFHDLFLREWKWFAAVVASYALTSSAGLIKFRRFPSYHTRAAKTCWLLVSLAALAVFTSGLVWPVRVAAAAVVWTNLEATLMTFVLDRWQVNVPSLWHAWQIRKRGREDAGPRGSES